MFFCFYSLLVAFWWRSFEYWNGVSVFVITIVRHFCFVEIYLLEGESVERGENVCSSSSRASSAFSERRLSRVVDEVVAPTFGPLNPPDPVEL